MLLLIRQIGNIRRNFCSQVISTKDIRNIGIIAHIDAGKTTITERFLYLAGATRSIGDVDSGSTVTDFLDIERERGITVQSAAVSLKWNNSHINLIDTPGHVDFTVEVERSTRVLDGVVTILDAKSGVQAQTRTVWRQASKFSLPSIFFINKMDKPGTNTTVSLESIEEKLNIKGLLTVLPIYKGDDLFGFIDVLSEKSLKLADKRWNDLEKPFVDDFNEQKNELCYQISDLDPVFMKLFMDIHNGDYTKITSTDLYTALLSITASRKGAVVSCGSALRCDQSVKPLLDQITKFLPSPEKAEKEAAEAFGNNFSSLVFKISHEKRKGQLSYLRVYTGTLRSGAMVYNVNRDGNEGPLRLFVPYADELRAVPSVKAGDIAVVSGLKNTVTGDTLIASEAAVLPTFSTFTTQHLRREGKHVYFSGIDIPDSVYFCSIEAPSISAIHDFEKALFQISIEDPSIRVRQDKQTGQTVIETMGELHLEIIKDKFLRDYGLNVFIGPLQIAYREMINRKIEHTATVSDEQGESGRNHSAAVTLLLEPKPNVGIFKKVLTDLPSGSHPIRYEWQKAITEGCTNALYNGVILGFPVQDVQITLKGLTASGGRVNTAILSAAAGKCVTEALKLAGAHLMEPVVRVEITVEDSEEGNHGVLAELHKRRAQIENCEQDSAMNEKIVALMPLAELEGFSTAVRILTSGRGLLHVQVENYVIVNEDDEKAILAKLRAY